MKHSSNAIARKYAVSLLALGVMSGEVSALAQEGGTQESEELAVETGQPAEGEGTRALDVVYVTARKREEREIDVPVTMAAIPATEIDRRGLNDLTQLATAVPALRISNNTNALGGTLTLRGVSSATSTASIEQAVAVNVDGIPVSYAGIVKLGQFDLGQVEVLKGPQALFFGDSSELLTKVVI